MTDWELPQRYAGDRKEAAFAALVARYLALVFNAARRQLPGNADLADDVAQSVFFLLARQASTISPRQALAGWLYPGTCYCCQNVKRTEARRRKREREVALQSSNLSEPGSESLSELLDEGIS